MHVPTLKTKVSKKRSKRNVDSHFEVSQVDDRVETFAKTLAAVIENASAITNIFKGKYITS